MLAAALDKLANVVLDSCPWLFGCRRAGVLINSATTHLQIQGFELAHININPIAKLLQLMKGPVLKIQRCKINMTQGNKRMSERRPSEVPVLIV